MRTVTQKWDTFNEIFKEGEIFTDKETPLEKLPTVFSNFTLLSDDISELNILLEDVPISLEAWCDTWWESWINTVKPLCFHFKTLVML